MTVVNYPFWTDIFFTSPFTLTHYIISSSIPTYIHLNLRHTLFFFFSPFLLYFLFPSFITCHNTFLVPSLISFFLTICEWSDWTCSTGKREDSERGGGSDETAYMVSGDGTGVIARSKGLFCGI